MNTNEAMYLGFTPVELWRLGVRTSARLDKPRVPPRPSGAQIDIQTFVRNGVSWVKGGSGGVSTFDGKNPRLSGVYWWTIPAGSPIPDGLRITKNHKDRITGLTHYRIEPMYDLPLSHFVRLLSVFAQNARQAFSTENKEQSVHT